jgi:hypothetical protein
MERAAKLTIYVMNDLLHHNDLLIPVSEILQFGYNEATAPEQRCDA